MQPKESKYIIKDRGKFISIEILNEKLDLFDTPDILTGIETTLKKLEFPDCLIDLSRISLIDSTGIGLLIALQNMLSKNSSRLAITGVTERVAEIFRITKMGTYFKIFESMEEAEHNFS